MPKMIRINDIHAEDPLYVQYVIHQARGALPDG